MTRTVLIRRIHAAATALGLDEDAYRDKLFAITGSRTCRDLSDDELARALKQFQPRTSLHPYAAKARAIWIGLHNLGAVEGTDSALDAFTERQTKCVKLIWVNSFEARKLTEALKAMALREGWEIPSDDPGGMKARVNLVLAQWRKLAAIGAVKIADEGALMHWAHNQQLVRAFSSPRQWKRHELDLAAKKLGQWIRKAQKDFSRGDAETRSANQKRVIPGERSEGREPIAPASAGAEDNSAASASPREKILK